MSEDDIVGGENFWAVFPFEPTRRMLEAGQKVALENCDVDSSGDPRFCDQGVLKIYEAMRDASPIAKDTRF